MIACIYLASGFGRRFGSNKLLWPLAGKPMFQYGLDALCALKRADICPVVVTQYDEVTRYAAARGVPCVYNAHAEEGIASSVCCGTSAMPEAEWYAFFVADQPWLREETVESFLAAALASGKRLASVRAGEVPGNPTLFHRSYREELLALRGDKGGRRILRAHPEEVFWFEVSAQELKDVDFTEEG